MGLDAVEIIIEIEKELNVAFNDEDASNIHTVNDLCNLTFSMLSTLDQEKYTLEGVQQIVISVISNKQGIHYEKIALNSTLVKDLGID